MTASILLGAGIGVGTVLIAAGVRGVRLGPRWVARIRAQVPALVLAAVAAALVQMATGWPVLALLAGTAVLTVPRIVARSKERNAVARSEAIAQWAEMLRDTMAGAAGLEEAIVVSARRPPSPIAGHVQRLSARLERRPTPESLTRFAADVDDPAADLLVAALVAATTNETRNLGALLAALVETTRDQVAMRATIDAGRSQIRSATRLVLGIASAFTIALLLFSAEYLAPYSSWAGQLWLVVVGAVVAASLVLLARLDRIDMPSARLVTTAGVATHRSGDR